MKIEHTRVSHDGLISPQKTTYWTVEHDGKQYQIQQEVNSSGRPLDYEYHVNRLRIVKVAHDLSTVSASSTSFVDITLAVMLAKFVKENAA